MNQRIFFMAAILERLGQPAFFCRMVAITLRTMTALIALLSLTIFFKVGKLTFELTPNHVLGGILFEVCFVLAVYAAVHVFWLRARDIELLQSAESYAISTTVLLLKLAGEAYCAFVILMAVGGGLFVWFTNQGLGDVLGALVRILFPRIGDDPSFLGGIEFMTTGVLIGIGVLILCYAASQILSLLVRSPRNGSQQAVSNEVNQGYRSRFGA